MTKPTNWPVPPGWKLVPDLKFPCDDYRGLGACDDECRCFKIEQKALRIGPPDYNGPK
jgi:hypothetical protein